MILHILSSATHSVRFVEFMQKYFDLKKHKFVYVRPDICKYGLSNFKEVEHIFTLKQQLKLIYLMQKADKIILHGLWRHEVINLLYFQKWLLKKCYWVLWGGDFCLGKESYSRRHNFVLQNVRHLISIAGDYEYVKKEYNTKGEVFYSKSFYVSNVFNGELYLSNKDGKLVILIGNSADPLNLHKDILNALKPYRDSNIELICPLSYGSDKEYQDEIIEYGKNIFGAKFKPLVEFMPLNVYLDLLSSLDIAIFAHKNQQAYGNIIQLLGMGKKVYMRKTTAYNEVLKNGLKIFDFDSGVDLCRIDDDSAIKNHHLTKNIYSLENMLSEFKELFGVDNEAF
ncbi:TDP-N-acetylfucosamine:lipid II N-acetylfucosaminyltransferase [Helicobacter winghamensis]|uniref:TDP-N-acetylfucosamine:lipid II N-acetylfucosaminyltransferase n=1 Tax=Helicobacter winghamensis TaxID=157268 RepID=UPI00279BDD31